MYNDGSFYMGGMHGFWWIFWVPLIGVLMFYGWGRTQSGQRRRPQETPHEVLQRRLASGDITPEEYEKSKALLERNGGTGA